MAPWTHPILSPTQFSPPTLPQQQRLGEISAWEREVVTGARSRVKVKAGQNKRQSAVIERQTQPEPEVKRPRIQGLEKEGGDAFDLGPHRVGETNGAVPGSTSPSPSSSPSSAPPGPKEACPVDPGPSPKYVFGARDIRYRGVNEVLMKGASLRAKDQVPRTDRPGPKPGPKGARTPKGPPKHTVTPFTIAAHGGGRPGQRPIPGPSDRHVRTQGPGPGTLVATGRPRSGGGVTSQPCVPERADTSPKSTT